jgi:glycerol-3-phosphate dehydrogenase
MTVFPCPSALGKGILVSPTVHGNVIVGPDSKVVKRGFLECTKEGLDSVRKGALRLIPSINLRASIRNFSGIRADAGGEDFIVGESKTVKGFFNMAGIKSPGLTSAPAIAKELAGIINKAGLEFKPNEKFVGSRKIVRMKELPEDEKRRLIKENPAYGLIVCRCQQISEGEILDALHRPLPCISLDGVKRRCTPGMGRCQGGFCGPKVHNLISQELNKPPSEVDLDRRGMYIVTGPTKED